MESAVVRALALFLAALLVTSCSSGSRRPGRGSPATGGTDSTAGGASHSVDVRPAPVPANIDAAGVTPVDGPTSAAPSSITSDCSTDVSDALQQWVDSVPDGSTIALRPGACYRVEKILKFRRRHNLVIDGRGATVKATTPGTGDRLSVRNRAHVVITGSSNITLRDLVVRGANPHAGTGADAYQPQYEAQAAFQLGGDDGVFLDRVQAYDVYGDFVYVGGLQNQPSRRITVARSTFDRNGRQGVAVTNAEDVLLIGNTVKNVARSFVDLEPNIASQEARQIRIVSNTTGAIRNYWLADKGVGGNIGDITITDNVMQERAGALSIVVGPKRAKRGPFTFERNELQITGDVSDEGAQGAFLFVNAERITLRGNEVNAPSDKRLAGVELRGCSDVTVDNNEFDGLRPPVVADGATQGVHVS